MPLAVGLPNIEIMPAIVGQHAGKQGSLPAVAGWDFPAPRFDLVPQIKPIVRLKIAHHVLRRIGAKHLRHTGFGPLLVDRSMASPAGLRTAIFGDRMNSWWGVRR